MKEDINFIFVFCFVIGFGLGVVLVRSSTETYQENVCQYLGGTTHDDICVKGQTVVNIPKKT